MKTKHTKGNWTAAKNTVFWEVHTDLKEKHLSLNILLCGEDKKNRLTDLHLTEENEANAKLIAAAPDLLEALNELNDWVKKLDTFSTNDNKAGLYDAVKKAEKAIEKALK